MPLAIGGAGIVSSIIGGIAGQNAGAGDRAAGVNAINDAYQKLANIGMPPDEAKKIVYQQFQQKGILTPELEKVINQGPSQMAGVTGSSDAKKAQLQALQILQQRGQGGLTPEDRSALNEIRNQIATDTEAKRQQIMQNFAARGQGGSGNELIAALQKSQSGANEESQAGDRLGAMASQNALQAIGAAGTLGGQIEQQQFGEGAEKAKAQDVINNFNTQNQVNQQARNVTSQNSAQASNLNNAQQISNTNTQQNNQELLRENQAQRQQYLDTLNRASTINAGAHGYASDMNNAASQASQAAAAPWTAIGAGATTVASNGMNNKAKYGETGFAEGGNVDYREGGHVPGKAPVPGNSPKNDIVDAKLSPGEYVLPRSVTQKPNFGKRLAKLLEDHHQLRKDIGE